MFFNSYVFKPPPSGDLYTWNVGTTYTFTNGGLSGATAMSTLPVYSAPFYPTYITMPQNGYQYLTIGSNGTYEFTCFGARGSSGPGTGGNGGTMRGRISLSKNDILIICVGHIGLYPGGINGGGGGGMTSIFLSSGGTGTPSPLLIAGGGGGTAGPGTGSPPVNYNGFGTSSSWDTESTASALLGSDRSAGSATQISVATAFANSTFSYGIIDSSGSRLTGVGSVNLGASAGGWGGAGCGGGGAGNGGGGSGWRGSVNTPSKEGGRAGTNFARTTLSSVSYVGNNTGTASITIQRIS
jgi:hypothetical protein